MHPVDVRVVVLKPRLPKDHIVIAKVCDVQVAPGVAAAHHDEVVADLGAWAFAAVCQHDAAMRVIFGSG